MKINTRKKIRMSNRFINAPDSTARGRLVDLSLKQVKNALPCPHLRRARVRALPQNPVGVAGYATWRRQGECSRRLIGKHSSPRSSSVARPASTPFDARHARVTSTGGRTSGLVDAIIDGVAEVLTGAREHFWLEPTTNAHFK
jgi:hypothetical protein